MWNNRILGETHFRKKAFRRIYNATNNIRAELQLRDVDQTCFEETSDPLSIEGIVYAIIHIPSGKIYVGQTIVGAFKRFQQHWYSRKERKGKSSKLHRIMEKQNVRNFLIWPLEKIDPSLYCYNGVTNKRDFRRAATIRERFWVQRLQTLQPRGLNVYVPMGRSHTRRLWRPKRFTHHHSTTIGLHENQAIDFTDVNAYQINLNLGPEQSLRKTTQKWLNMTTSHSLQDLTKDISKHSLRHRSGVLRWLSENVPNDKVNNQIFLVETIIRELHSTFRGFKSSKKKEFGEFIKVVHSHELITFAGLRSVLHEPEIRKLHNQDRNICDKQASPLGRSLCNYTQVSKNVTENMAKPAHENCPCRCNNLLYKTDDLVEGHVVSCDPLIFKSTYLQELFQYGFKFRHNISVESIMESLQLGLDDYYHKKTQDSTDAEFIMNMDQWKQKVYNRCRENLEAYMKKNPHVSRGPFKMCSVIKQLKETFVIAPVDKAQHNLSLICKQWYLYVLSKELSSKAYSAVSDKTVKDILAEHRAWNIKHGFEHVDNLSYLYWIGKFHKDPPGSRFICGVAQPAQPSKQEKKEPQNTVQAIFARKEHVSKNSTTSASIYLSKQLQTVMKLLQEKDQKQFKITGVRKCWFIKSTEEVFLEVKANSEYLKDRRPRTFDFNTMYTNLQHDRIIRNVKKSITEAFEYIDTLPFMEREKIIQQLDSPERIMEIVIFIVKNTYLCTNGGVVRHQKIGLPMGTNSAPEIANLTLYPDEKAFVEQLIEQDLRLAQRHNLNFRLIDDVLTWDEEPPSPEMYGLQWSETTCNDGSVNFLGGKIRNDGKRIAIELFDKAAEWKFPFLRYPHFDSNVPYHQPAGVFQGQLCCF